MKIESAKDLRAKKISRKAPRTKGAEDKRRDRQENTKNKLKDKNLYPLSSWRLGEMKKKCSHIKPQKTQKNCERSN